MTVTDPSTGTSATTTADHYTYVTPPSPPTVTGVSPSSGSTAGGNTVTITGTGFAAADTVKFASSAASNVVVGSASSLTATAPPGTAGTVDVTVTDPSTGTSATTTADHYTYVTPPSPPTVTGVSPSSGSTAGGNTVTITGTGFAAADTVKFASSAASNVVVGSASSLTATAPPGTAGTVDVTVTDPSTGTSATTSADHYTYVTPACAQTPTVTTEPSSVTVTAGQSATFTAAASTPANCSAPTVQWQVSTDHGTTFADITAATSATLTVSSTATSESGDEYRAVFTDGAGATDSSAATLTVNPASSTAPVVTTVFPNSGGPFSLVIILGRNLEGATQVAFGGTPTIFLQLNGRVIIALAPSGPSGTVDVTVTTGVGTSQVTAADRFRYSRRGFF